MRATGSCAPRTRDHGGSAPTGARQRTWAGKFHLAHDCILLLDEIGDVPRSLQAKLLRTVEEQEIEPLRCNTLQPLDARVITAARRRLLFFYIIALQNISWFWHPLCYVLPALFCVQMRTEMILLDNRKGGKAVWPAEVLCPEQRDEPI